MQRLLSVLLFLLLLPAAALGAVETEYLCEAGGKLGTLRHTFSGEMPEAVAQVLQSHGWGDARCLSGLAIVRLVLTTPEGQEDAYRMSDALVTVERGGRRTLLGLRWSQKAGISQLTDYGAMGLSWEDFRWRFADAGMQTADYVLTAENRSWRLAVTGENLWYVKASGDVEWNAGRGCFSLDGERLPTPWTGCLACLQRFDAFPDTAQEARLLASQTWGDLPSGRLATVSGNLRTQPTGSAPSLGVYHPTGVTAQLLDTAAGAHAPWYQVRIGDTVGWVSSPYAEPVGALTELVQDPFARPLPVRTIEGDVCLFDRPEGAVKSRLAPGDQVQVLAECPGGWLHVAVPSCALRRWLDPSGVFGYIRDVNQ